MQVNMYDSMHLDSISDSILYDSFPLTQRDSRGFNLTCIVYNLSCYLQMLMNEKHNSKLQIRNHTALCFVMQQQDGASHT